MCTNETPKQLKIHEITVCFMPPDNNVASHINYAPCSIL